VRRELDVERSNRFGSSAFSGRGDLPLSYQDRVWSTLVSGRRFSMGQILPNVDRELAQRLCSDSNRHSAELDNTGIKVPRGASVINDLRSSEWRPDCT